jgi:hypothetical protein
MVDEKMITDMHVNKLADISKAKDFLGAEFLTWLWHQTESEGKNIEFTDSNRRTFSGHMWVDDRVSLESPTSLVHHQTLRGGEPSRSAEAAAALESGKIVKELKVGIEIFDVGEFIATLDAATLSPRSLNLPVLIDDAVTENRNNAVEARIEQVELYLDLIDHLFKKFLESRIENNWETHQVNDIRTWIKERSKNTHQIH